MGLFSRTDPHDFVEGIRRSPHRMPRKELAFLKKAYGAATVILEYGSGLSTLLAADMPGKTLFSVESDLEWSKGFETHFAKIPPAAHIVMHGVDIGPTGQWGNPVDNSGWQRYHRYPLSIWEHPEFLHPDLVFIDGRFRMACWITAMLRITRPTVVLFDDYANRPQYHAVEEFAKPVETCDRIARFELTPREFPADDLMKIVEMYTMVA